jgi:hypothetical protein
MNATDIYATVGQQNRVTSGNQFGVEIRLNEFAE